MEKLKLNFLHLCDAASVDNLGKISILGIFSRVFLPKVPSKFLKFTVVGNVSFIKTEKNPTKIQIKIFDANKKELQLASPLFVEFSMPANATKNEGDVNFIFDIGNLDFKTFGKYSLIIYVDGKDIESKSFIVEERKTN
ncbi:MAG: hypothetical protein HYV37_00995 [Candidatus Levyibacteriota bacterium]|nr:MAG: hypothetical protein HYV37_00995 [Candidatus Levybacteria bacterium]